MMSEKMLTKRLNYKTTDLKQAQERKDVDIKVLRLIDLKTV